MADGSQVLVADDDPELVTTVCDILRARGHAGIGVLSGEEAVARVRVERFDCLMMDVHMPGMGGLAALDEVKRLAPALPVLLMSADADVELAVEARRRGAFSLLPKPFDMHLVLSFLSMIGRVEDLVAFGGDPAFGQELATLLAGLGYRVEAEREPGKVLERMEGGYKLAVLLDVGRGDEGSLEVLRSVLARFPTKPVLMVAERDEQASDAIRRGLRGGVHTCLSRPLQREPLVDLIEDIRRRKLAAALGEPFGSGPRTRASA